MPRPEEASLAEERIPTARVLTFSAPVVGLFLGSALTTMYLLKFATDVLGVAPAAMGAVLLGGRIWDAVSDPLVGHLSDRTRTRMGRRRPWILASAIPFGLAMMALWSPPGSLEGGPLLAWLSVSFLLFYTFYTTFRVPHLAFAAELSRGYHDRTRVFGLMQAMELLGMLGAAGAVMWLENSGDPRAAAMSSSLGIAVVSAVLMVFCAVVSRERPEYQTLAAPPSQRVIADVLGNPHARLLIGVFFLEQLGFAVLLVLLPFLSDYVLETPGSTAYYMASALLASLASIPVWLAGARRFGKRPVWLASIVGKIVMFVGLLGLGAGDFWPAILCVGIFGALAGCGSVVGPSLKADVVDWDEARTGERKEGAYFATWNFAQKTASGIAGWLTGTMLAVVGFEPNAVQSEEVRFGIRALVSLWPLGFQVIALVGVWRFGLDEAAHRALRRPGGP